MRFGELLVAYFLVGAVLWGGGVISWQQSGVGVLVLEQPASGDVEVNQETGESLEQAGGPIQQVGSQFEGTGLVAVWNVIVPFLGYLFWPITVLLAVNAPPRVTATLGGGLSTAFLGAVIKLVRTSA